MTSKQASKQAEGRDFVLTANSDIGVPIASVKMMMMLYMQQVKAAGFGSGLGFRDLKRGGLKKYLLNSWITDIAHNC